MPVVGGWGGYVVTVVVVGRVGVVGKGMTHMLLKQQMLLSYPRGHGVARGGQQVVRPTRRRSFNCCNASPQEATLAALVPSRLPSAPPPSLPHPHHDRTCCCPGCHLLLHPGWAAVLWCKHEPELVVHSKLERHVRYEARYIGTIAAVQRLSWC